MLHGQRELDECLSVAAGLKAGRGNDAAIGPIRPVQDNIGYCGSIAPRGSFIFMQPNSRVIVSGLKRPFRRSRDFKVLKHVTSYRLYRLDGVNRVASGEWIDADDDRSAVETARKVSGRGGCEVWQGRRLVARLEGGGR